MKTHYGFSTVCGLIFLLSGCANHDPDSTLQGGAKKLSARQVRELINGSSVHLDGYGQAATVDFAGDGTLAGRNTAGEKDKGEWQVKGDALCLHFKKWGQGDRVCYQVAGSGSAYQLFNRKGMLIYELTVLTPGGDKEDKDGSVATAQATTGTADHPSNPEQEAAADRVALPASPQAAADVDFLIRQSAQNCPGCNLARVNLAGQTLIGANLQGANLTEADLSHANLRRANLRGANLYRANLRQTDLAGADLTGANLSEAIRE